jgi:aryl-alcohol dehydrogenase-like predicted oxidoreductase
VARGGFTDAPPEPAAFDAKDIRRPMPRFTAEHWGTNLALRERLAALAREAGCTLAQLSLAWVLSRGEHVIAIPGTTKVEHLRENMGTLQLNIAAELLDRVSALMQPAAVSGPRYTAANQAEVDTEVWPA